MACGARDDGPEPVCPAGSAAVTFPPESGADRLVEGTTLLACERAGVRVGRQVEWYPSGAVAAEVRWEEGARHGEATYWDASGAFRASETWERGALRGWQRSVAGDGRIVEVDVQDGRANGLRTWPAGTPVDEWSGGERVQGHTYQRAGE
jgi:hypothetical protein